MLLPEDPNRKPSLWDSVAMQLTQEAMCFIIEEGFGNPFVEAKPLTKNIAESALSRLRMSKICRISGNRGRAISPHFSGDRKDNTILLTEFLSYPSEGTLTVNDEKLKRDLEIAVINLFFTDHAINTILVPLNIAPWVMSDIKICLTEKGLVFKKL
jgi:hypothetical protein